MKRFSLSFFFLLLSSLSRAGETISLHDYLSEVGGQNLTLKASRASVDAAEAKSVGLALPEPMVGVTQMRDQSGTSNGYEVYQTIPFPTKLASDRKARKLEAQAEKEAAHAMQKEVIAQARLLYISVWVAQERIKFLKEKRSAIQQHIRLSTASSRSDSSIRIHTLKAESDFDLLESEILEAEQTFKEKQIGLAAFAKRDPSQYRPDVQEAPLTELPTIADLTQPSQLEAKRLNVEMLGARESEAKSSWLPDFNLRYRDIGGTPMTAGYKEVMVGATLPFAFFWEPNAKSKSASAEKLKAEAEYHQEKLSVQAKSSALLTRAESIRKQLDLIQSKLLPRAEKRMRLVQNLAPRDMESLQAHREGMEEFPELKLRTLDLRMQYEEAVSELLSLTSESNQ